MEKPIETFYTSFKAMDAESMVACYHKDIVFNDPAFGTLKGERAKNMWRMLVASQKGKSFEIHFDSIIQNEKDGTAHWEAKYIFSKTGRKVHNIIEAQFKLQDGLIINHQDSFNLHAWARQAMGFKGYLLGGTDFFKKKLQLQTNKMLNHFESKKS